jgi:hypothetical protein
MSFDRKKIAHKVIWPKVHLTESSFDRKLFLKMIIWPKAFAKNCHLNDDRNGLVGSIADLIPKGPGFESQISHGFSLM